jgi:hypothetical protein
MAGTKHTRPPVEGDGISYRGIVWFVVILTLVTVTCQILIWVLLKAMQHQTPDVSTQASPMAQPITDRQAPDGRVYPDMVSIGNTHTPAPRLLVLEPAILGAFRAHENDMLTTYGVADPVTGAYRVPIERAKELVIQRGLPVRGKQ